ncbi:MAG: hypothetical protein PHT58_03065 [Eubacteriales bacterium]|nr:hypothetical protein [Eubacteriales bacterium]
MKRNGEPNKAKPRKAVEIPSDVNGSYTGMSHDGSRPVQDADDL